MLVIVKGKMVPENVTCFRHTALVFEVNLFVFDGASQAMHEDDVNGLSMLRRSCGVEVCSG